MCFGTRRVFDIWEGHFAGAIDGLQEVGIQEIVGLYYSKRLDMEIVLVPSGRPESDTPAPEKGFYYRSTKPLFPRVILSPKLHA